MKQSAKRIKKEIKNLCKIVNEAEDPVESRIAYTVQNALRWATENTVGWETPSEGIVSDASILRIEI